MQLEFGGRRYAVAAGDFVIGSDPDSTLVLTAPAVLPRHAVIRSVGQGMVILVPAAPGAETLVNGVRLGSDPTPLMPGDKIAIGGQEITVADSGRAGVPPVMSPPPGAASRLNETVAGFPAMRRPPPMPRAEAPPLASLLVKSGQRKGERLAVLSPVTNFGRAEFSDLRLPDPSVSASHAKLQLREGVWTLADLGSTNGTKVDGEPVREETALSPGVTISIGEVQLLFEPQDIGKVPGSGSRMAAPPAPSAPPVTSSPAAPNRTRQAVVAVLVALGILLLVGYFLLG
jgi:pSer/pThr/pTyr-binding forkhead associated (FHA) protein